MKTSAQPNRMRARLLREPPPTPAAAGGSRLINASQLRDRAARQHRPLRQPGRRAALDLLADEDRRARRDPRRRRPAGIGTAKRASAGTTPSEAGTVSPSGSSQSSNDRPGGAAPATRVKRSTPASRSSSATSCTSPTVGATVATSSRRLGSPDRRAEKGEGHGPDDRGRRHAPPQRRARPEPREQRRRPAEQPPRRAPAARAAAPPARSRRRARRRRPASARPRRRSRVGGDAGRAGGLLRRVQSSRSTYSAASAASGSSGRSSRSVSLMPRDTSGARSAPAATRSAWC